jgi:hypothetical protein
MRENRLKFRRTPIVKLGPGNYFGEEEIINNKTKREN